MILMIDNYDSFTYNLVQYLGELGAELEVYRNDQVSLQEVEDLAPEKVVISPGPCTPNEAGISVELIQRFAGRFPILGVCLGHQSVGQAFGGNIVGAPTIMHGKVSEIYHDGGTIFKDLSQGFVATRYHSLVVDRETLPECMEVSAKTSEGTIMGLRHKEFAVEGVQFHPESILTGEGKNLLRNFLEA